MKNYLKLFVVILSLLVSPAFGQDDTTKTFKYPPDGVYYTFSAFRNGKPDLLKEQVAKSTYDPEYTLKKWSNTEFLNYTDASGARRSLNRDSVWGFAENGVVHVCLGNKFHRISLLGQLSYFLESYPVIKGNMAPVVTDTRATSYYRLLDMETGDFYDYSIDNLQTLLERDEVLYNEFVALETPKLKRKKMYSFVERYNNLYPLRAAETP